jgi:hypothetical protein
MVLSFLEVFSFKTAPLIKLHGEIFIQIHFKQSLWTRIKHKFLNTSSDSLDGPLNM